MKKKVGLLFLTGLFLVCAFSLSNFNNAVPVSADDPAPETSYQIEIDNGNKIFCMYPVWDADNENSEDYLKSGLYYNTSPLENIYLINSPDGSNPRYFYEWDLVFSEDGICFAHLPWTWTSTLFKIERGGPTVEFYKNGSLTEQYFLPDVAKNASKLDFSVSHVSWENRELRNFDAESNILSVTAKDGITTKFDLTTGNILDGGAANNNGGSNTSTTKERNYKGCAEIAVGLISAIGLTAIAVFVKKKS